jgi:nicotinate-nucleotide adenylyltransferase
LICLYGGTFDPVHRGHLHAALTVCEAVDLRRVHLVLSARPSHREHQGAEVDQRWAMLQLACEDDERLFADDREIHRSGPSYTVHTLEAARSENPGESICWVIGWDAYRLLPSWYEWQRVSALANLIVLQRPGFASGLDETMQTFTRERQVTSLSGHASGAVLLLEQEMLTISAAGIRDLLRSGKSADHLLPNAVATYIRQHQLYGVISDP